MTPEDRRAHWDERHREREIEEPGPNPSLAAHAGDGIGRRALDVACGAGTNAVWLARHGWAVTAVDWSRVALEKARARADDAGVVVDWVEADLREWSPPESRFDLVSIVYLHLPPEERRSAYGRAARGLAAGGRLIVIGHDRTNLSDGVGGPQDEAVLFTATEIAEQLVAAVPDLVLDVAEAVRRGSTTDRVPIDAVLVAHRKTAI